MNALNKNWNLDLRSILHFSDFLSKKQSDGSTRVHSNPRKVQTFQLQNKLNCFSPKACHANKNEAVAQKMGQLQQHQTRNYHSNFWLSPGSTRKKSPLLTTAAKYGYGLENQSAQMIHMSNNFNCSCKPLLCTGNVSRVQIFTTFFGSIFDDVITF